MFLRQAQHTHVMQHGRPFLHQPKYACGQALYPRLYFCRSDLTDEFDLFSIQIGFNFKRKLTGEFSLNHFRQKILETLPW